MLPAVVMPGLHHINAGTTSGQTGRMLPGHILRMCTSSPVHQGGINVAALVHF